MKHYIWTHHSLHQEYIVPAKNKAEAIKKLKSVYSDKDKDVFKNFFKNTTLRVVEAQVIFLISGRVYTSEGVSYPKLTEYLNQ